jgi:phage terminase large subunit-like protein
MFSQMRSSKSESFREIERKIKEKFTYLNNKAFEYFISNVRGQTDSEERVRYDKVSPNFHINLFDSTVMAVKQAIIARDKKNKLVTWFD